VTAFAERVASGTLTSEFAAERRWHEGRVERLHTQHTEVVRDKLVAENKSRNLLEKFSSAEKEREDLSRRLAEEREGTEKARVEAQAALKGKCALGPFLSILVIECQRKCFCVDLCNVVDKVQIMSKGMFLDLVHYFMD
jgi:hypothetical protein